MNKRSNWAIPYAIFLAFFVVLPLILIFVYAFRNTGGGFTFQNFIKFFNEPEVFNTFLYSIEIAAYNTAICLLLGYPAAYILSNNKLNKSAITIMLFVLPMSINALIRTLATVELFDILNVALGEGTLIFGMVYNFLPFMIYPIYNTLRKIDPSYYEAAQDLGASPFKTFVKVTFPLSMPGIQSGITMVFMPTISTFAISEFLTNNKIKLFGTIIQENINSSFWNYGSALSLIMLAIIALTTIVTGDGSADAQKGEETV